MCYICDYCMCHMFIPCMYYIRICLICTCICLYHICAIYVSRYHVYVYHIYMHHTCVCLLCTIYSMCMSYTCHICVYQICAINVHIKLACLLASSWLLLTHKKGMTRHLLPTTQLTKFEAAYIKCEFTTPPCFLFFKMCLCLWVYKTS